MEVEKGAILEENEIEERQKREEQLMCIRRWLIKINQEFWIAFYFFKLIHQGCGGEGHPEDVEGVQDEEAAQGEAQEEAQKEALNSCCRSSAFHIRYHPNSQKSEDGVLLAAFKLSSHSPGGLMHEFFSEHKHFPPSVFPPRKQFFLS